MTAETYQTWPFQPPEGRHREQAARWWELCYLPGAVERQLGDGRLWTVITGAPRSGKSVALAAWVEREAGRRFIVDYTPERWPGARHAWFMDKADHVSHLLAAAGNKLRDWLEAHPDRAAELSRPGREFLRGLLEWMGGPRMYQLFLRKLPPESADVYQATTGLALDDSGYTLWQMEEMTALLREFDLGRLSFVVDFPAHYSPAQAEQLGALFGLLDAMLSPRFDVMAAVPETAFHDSRLVERSRGRIDVFYTEWTEENCRAIADRHVRAALDAPPEIGLATYASAGLLAAASALLQEEYGYPSPGAWVELAEVVLHLTLGTTQKLKHPLGIGHLDAVKLRFYALYMKLRFDPDLEGVWRGPRKITLPPKPLRFLRLLRARNGAAVNWWKDEELQEIAPTNSDYVNSLASRIRSKIEPSLDEEEKKKKEGKKEKRKKWVYVRNDGGQDGYWLDNFV